MLSLPGIDPVSKSVWRQLRINTLWQWKGYTNFLNIGGIVLFMHLNMVWYEILLKYSQSGAESAFFFTFLYILRTARGFWKYCKKRGGGGCLALKSHIICSSKKSCVETKADIVCFSLNNVFLIDPKMTTTQRKKVRTDFFFFLFFCDFFFFAIWSPIFSSFSSLFLLFPSSFHLVFTTHLLRLAI